MKNGLLKYFLFLIYPYLIYSASLTFSGALGSAWSVSTNWFPQQVPVTGDVVTVQTSSNVDIGKKFYKIKLLMEFI
jgi:hypothetical protein